MNAMGHSVRTYIGADQKEIAKTIKSLVPDYMPMGSQGMGEMGAMEMPIPDNTLPMMTGFAQFGPVEMGGMFSVLKVREGLDRKSYADPGWYKQPQGTQAYEYKGQELDAMRVPAAAKPAEFSVADPRTKNTSSTHEH